MYTIYIIYKKEADVAEKKLTLEEGKLMDLKQKYTECSQKLLKAIETNESLQKKFDKEKTRVAEMMRIA